MTISLSPELDRFLNESLSSGLYGSVEEVLTAAFRALRKEEESLTSIMEAHSDFLAGRVQSLEESDAKFRKERNLPPFAG